MKIKFFCLALCNTSAPITTQNATFKDNLFAFASTLNIPETYIPLKIESFYEILFQNTSRINKIKILIMHFMYVKNEVATLEAEISQLTIHWQTILMKFLRAENIEYRNIEYKKIETKDRPGSVKAKIQNYENIVRNWTSQELIEFLKKTSLSGNYPTQIADSPPKFSNIQQLSLKKLKQRILDISDNLEDDRIKKNIEERFAPTDYERREKDFQILKAYQKNITEGREQFMASINTTTTTTTTETKEITEFWQIVNQKYQEKRNQLS